MDRSRTERVAEDLSIRRLSGGGGNGAERNHGERQLGGHGSPRNSQRGELVVFLLWSSSGDRAGDECCSWRVAKGARIRQGGSVRAGFLRGATGVLRHRAFHTDEDHRVAHTGVDPVAYVLGVLCRTLLYRGRAEPGDEDSGASGGEFAGLDVFPFRRADGCPGLGRHPQNRIFLALTLRELSFSGGPLALAASLSDEWGERGRHIVATIARYFVAIPVLFYSLEQFMHGDHVPGLT